MRQCGAAPCKKAHKPPPTTTHHSPPQHLRAATKTVRPQTKQNKTKQPNSDARGYCYYLPPDPSGRLQQIDLSDDVLVAQLFASGLWEDTLEPLEVLAAAKGAAGWLADGGAREKAGSIGVGPGFGGFDLCKPL